ncbi:hypothetical protein PG994_012273 [Apiospora phragmitis]|uniref:Uncharacterized protein n=1 Tax=Apiospora phragmitis TaxID=2905665 RepID=A0ABR1TVG6_9PEZI
MLDGDKLFPFSFLALHGESSAGSKRRTDGRVDALVYGYVGQLTTCERDEKVLMHVGTTA